MDTTDPQPQAQPQPLQAQLQTTQHQPQHQPQQAPASSAAVVAAAAVVASSQHQQPHPQHIRQPTQAQLQQQHAQPTGYGHAIPYGYSQHAYPHRHPYQQGQYSGAGIPFNPTTMAFQPYTQQQYTPWQQPAAGFPPATAATPSSQEISSAPHVTTTTLIKRERKTAIIKDPTTNKELDLKAMAGAEPTVKTSSKTNAAATANTTTTTTQTPTATSATASPATPAKATAVTAATVVASATKTSATQSSSSTQSSQLADKKANINSITPINKKTTNTVTNSVTTSSSNDRTSTSSPPSISNILLRKVSEDTDSDKRQASATTITTTTTSVKATTVTPSTNKSTTTTRPAPVVEAAKPVANSRVELKVNNIDRTNHVVNDAGGKNDSPKNGDKEHEAEEEAKPVDGDKPVELVNETVNNEDSTEAKAEDKVTLNYQPGQYNPMSNRTGKKKYDRQFLIDVCEKICKLSVFDEDKRDDSMDNYSFNHVDIFAPPYSKNLPYLANNRQNDISRRPNQQNYMGRSSAGQERTRKIIAPSSSLTQEVELKTVENPWRPGKEAKDEIAPEVVEVEALKKKFRSILNKLTPNNFDNLAIAVTDLHIDTETKLGEVIDIVFAKALAEPGYCVLYGQMCSHLKKITAGTTNFGNTLLKRCQNQFQSDIYSGLNLDERKQKIQDETDPEMKKHLNEELYEEMYRCRMRGLGLIKFIGELYKIEMLNDKIMFDCISRLLNDTSEESLECLCDLLVTIGEKLDKSSQKNNREEKKAQKAPSKQAWQGGKSAASVVAMGTAQQQPNAVSDSITTLDDIFDRLHKIRKNKELPISLRIRFKLLDVCELREKEGWQSKRTKDNNPKKIDEIREAHMEKLENEKNRLQQTMGPRRSQEGRRGLGHSSGSSSQISSLANDSSVNRGGMSNMHGSASSHAIRDHSLDDKSRQNPSDSYEVTQHHQKLGKQVVDLLRNSSNHREQTASLRPASLRPNTTGSLRPTLPNRPSNAVNDNNTSTQ